MIRKLKIIVVLLFICHFGKAQNTTSDSIVEISPNLPTILEFRNNNAFINSNYAKEIPPIKESNIKMTCGCKGGPPPLFILDGKEMTGNLQNLDPQAIESISVVKDTTSAKQYGDKGKME